MDWRRSSIVSVVIRCNKITHDYKNENFCCSACLSGCDLCRPRWTPRTDPQVNEPGVILPHPAMPLPIPDGIVLPAPALPIPYKKA
ncbi:unnamed protein product [Arctia plantaginis]|uniref:Uncharacterized protein n=1 Tax=Arctia plantaginis TaxID=874455 RepID=A0A8S0ZW16_ARCPL|nr:unnamed protein product [Arctia plantaginis]